MFLKETKQVKHEGRRIPGKTRKTYEHAAKKANSQVLGSLSASMTLTIRTV